MKKLVVFLGTLLLGGSVSFAQTTVVSGNTIDTDGTAWVGGSITAQFVPNPSQPNINVYNINGVALNPAVTTQGPITLGANGSFSLTVYTSSAVSPAGSQWQFTICPLATSRCGILLVPAVGNTQNITAAITAVMPAPRFPAVVGNYGYADAEAILQLVPGSIYYNVTNSCYRGYSGSVWGCVTSNSGGSGTVNPSTAGNFAQYLANGAAVSGVPPITAQYNLALNGTGKLPIPSLQCDGATDNTAALNASTGAATFTGSISGTTLTVTAVSWGIIYPTYTITGSGVSSAQTIVAQLTGTTGGIGTYSVSASQSVGSTSILGTGYHGPIIAPSTGQGLLGSCNFGANVGGYATQWIIMQQAVDIMGGGMVWLHGSKAPATVYKYTGNGINATGQVAAIPVDSSMNATANIGENVNLHDFSISGPNNAHGDGLVLPYTNLQYAGGDYAMDRIAISGFRRSFVSQTWANLKIGLIQVLDGTSQNGGNQASTATSSDCAVVVTGNNADSTVIDKLRYQYENYASVPINPNNCVLHAGSGKGWKAFIGDTAHSNNVLVVGKYLAQDPEWGTGAANSAVTITGVASGGVLTSLIITGGTNYANDLLLTFSSECTTSPKAVMFSTAGIPDGYQIINPGVCPTSPSSVTVGNPTQTAEGYWTLGNTESRGGFRARMDVGGSNAVITALGEETGLTTLMPQFVLSGGTAYTYSSMDITVSSMQTQTPAVGPIPTVIASGGSLVSGQTYYVWYEAVGTVYGQTLNSGPGEATCTITVNGSSCSILTPVIGHASACTLYINETNSIIASTGWTTASTTCGSPYVVTGSEGSISLPSGLPVGNVPLAIMTAADGGGIVPIAFHCAQRRVDGAYANYGAMILLANGLYIDACSTSGVSYVTTLPSASAQTIGKRIAVYNTTGITGCFVGTGASTWTPDQCAGSGISGLTAGQLTVAGSLNTITSSIAYGTAGTVSTVVARDSGGSIWAGGNLYAKTQAPATNGANSAPGYLDLQGSAWSASAAAAKSWDARYQCYVTNTAQTPVYNCVLDVVQDPNLSGTMGVLDLHYWGSVYIPVFGATCLGTDSGGAIISNSSCIASSGVGGMTQYGIPVAATASTVTSSVYPATWTTGHTFLPVWQPSGAALAPVAVDATTITVGSAATATALAATPGQCSSGNYATGISAAGTANCATVQYSQLGGTAPTLPNGTTATTQPGGDNSGNLATTASLQYLTTAPAWLRYLGTGADGSYEYSSTGSCSTSPTHCGINCTSGSPCSMSSSGEMYTTAFTIDSGAYVSSNPGSGYGDPIIHSTGACTIAGTMLFNGNKSTWPSSNRGVGGGSAGGSGGGTAAGTAGIVSNLSIVSTSALGQINGGTAGGTSGGNGTNGASFATSFQRGLTNSGAGGLDGIWLTGATGVQGGSTGGAGGYPGGGSVMICASINGSGGVIDLSGAYGAPPSANSTGAGSGGGGGVGILSSQTSVSTWPTISVAGGPGGLVTVPQALATSGSCTTQPKVTLGATSGVLSSCTVAQAGAGCGTGTNITFNIVGGGGSGGTITPTWSGGALASCTASGGTGYTAATYTTSGTGGDGGNGWYAEFSGW